MDTRNTSRADFALPNPQEQSSVSEIELSEVAFHDNPILEKAAPSAPQRTWLTFLKKELEFLGVTQILIGLICLFFGTIVYSIFNISESEGEVFSSFKKGYPLWGAVFFAIAGFLSLIRERKNAMYLVGGRLGANIASSLAAGTGINILINNLKESLTYLYSDCLGVEQEDICFVVSFSIEMVSMLLLLTLLGFCSAVSLTIYGVGELLKRAKVPEDGLYEELNIYAPIYSELEDPEEMSPPTDS
ncbi:high affinity immunoglobulin epsilon receptor subunit beta [Elephas maximus indicus]|uniref:high affinity immunoglobulin epsilon receptor subunit beta n=1 Tax=Elephas maximus indicus TaxID=99487 RepID=UPI002116686E|nr:high affinity immunoglobulin epsilon receptor subunit beta [Elephas maximus indicus]XP_049748048.1 high affinity immunoglobulin epsilon receptor subunit beta [Elephas maximus indicus]XP_049748049.1 high affinity immunoglobulin epsilon receptor subunit beta [Elephas maximus indicus]